MASTHKSLRSSTADKRPTTSIADGQIALNTNAASPGLFFKDSAGTDIIKVGPVHVGTTAPNATPAVGGSSGNSTGEVWLDTSLTPVGVKIWNGSSWDNATPAGSTTVQGLLELATSAETQTGTDTARAVTPAGLQSKVSDSTSTTSSTTIASSTAVKSAYDLANAALPKTGGVVTGALEIGTTGSLSFEGATANDYETTVAVVDPTADRTVTIPDQSGNFLISGNASIVNADVNASAAIAGTKISPNFGSQTIQTTGVISHALGTAGAPTITFTGDTNTGVYSPGADQLALATNGTGRLFVDASGNVGVGTTSPVNTSLHGGLTLSGSSGAQLDLKSSAASDRDFYIKATSGTTVFHNNGASQPFIFRQDASERLRIDSSGRVGIGTSSLSTYGGKLSIVDGAVGGETTLVLANNSQDQFARLGINNNEAQIAWDNGDALVFGTATTSATSGLTSEFVRIDSSGRVGIGTTSPGSYSTSARELVVAGTTNPGITIAGNSGNTGTIMFADGTTGSEVYRGQIDYQHGTDSMVFFTNGGSEAFRVDSSQRLGVGTSAPSALLDVYLGSNVAGTIARFGGYNDGRSLVFSNTGIGNDHYINAQGGAGTITFQTASTDRVRIDSSGDLGLGTSSPSTILHIENDTGSGTVGEYPEIRLDNDESTGRTALSFYDGSTKKYDIFCYNGDSSLRFRNNASELARFDSSGRLLVGTSTSRDDGVSFQLEGVGYLPSTLQITRNSPNEDGGGIYLQKTRSSTNSGVTIVQSGDQLGYIKFRGADGTDARSVAAQIEAEVDGTPGSNDMPGRLVFSTTANGASSSTERVRINSSGRVLINSTGTVSSEQLHVYAANSQAAIFKRGNTSGTVEYVRFVDGSNNDCGSIDVNTTANTTAYTTSSDYRLKQNVQPLTGSINRVLQLKPCEWNWVNSPETRGEGFLAHEAQAVVPEAVTGIKDAMDDEGNPEYQGIDQSKLVPLLTAALQEALAKIETLEARLTAAGL